MNNLAIANRNFKPTYMGFHNFPRLVNGVAPTLILGGVLALLMGSETFAQVDGVDKIIQGVATSILPNLKFGTGVVAGALGLGIAIAGLLKTSPRMLLSGAGLAIVPATLWDSVVGTAATILIP